jgi:hypothetical protein
MKNLLIEEESYSEDTDAGKFTIETCILCEDDFSAEENYLYCFYDSKYLCEECIDFMMLILGE